MDMAPSSPPSHALPLCTVGLPLVLLILLSMLPYLFIATAEGGCTPDEDYQLTNDDVYYTPWTRSSVRCSKSRSLVSKGRLWTLQPLLSPRTRGQILSDDESGKEASATAVDTTGNAQLRALGKDVSLSYAHLTRRSSHAHAQFQSNVTSPSNPLALRTRAVRLKHWYRALSVRAWLRAEKIWLSFLACFTILFILSFTAPYVGYIWCAAFSFLPGLGVLVVLIVGRGTPSRRTVMVPFGVAWAAGEAWWLTYFFGGIAT